jgi:hypothetical protein
VVEVGFATVDHSDIRGSKPHNRDPSGAASDYKRGFGPKTYRIELPRILLPCTPRPLPTLPPYASDFRSQFTLSRPLQGLLLRSFYFDPDGPDKTQQLAPTAVLTTPLFLPLASNFR